MWNVGIIPKHLLIILKLLKDTSKRKVQILLFIRILMTRYLRFLMRSVQAKLYSKILKSFIFLFSYIM